VFRLVLVAAAILASWTATAAAAPERGFVLDARCRDGRPQGPYALRDDRGQLRVAGAFDEGVRTGSFFFWRANGVRAAHVPYDDNGARQGTVATWYDGEPGREPAMRFESEWRHGVREGETRSWYADGHPRTRADYERGGIVRADGWSDDGQPLAEAAARRLAEGDALEADADDASRDALILGHMPRC
jgi:antitoxin component YwqK of YwqJK toxin-antitoxin module